MISELRINKRQLDLLQNSLAQYTIASGKSKTEVLDKKGNDLRIQLYRGFKEAKWKGGKDIAWREARRRHRSGKGTIVRSNFLDDKYGSPPKFQRRKGYRSKSLRKTVALVPLNMRQQLVWQELVRRSRGIGVLAASWLFLRYRYNKTEGRFLVRNKSKTLGTLTLADRTPDSLRLIGFTPGMVEVSNRYGIADRAVREVNQDMEPYIRRKQLQKWSNILKKGGLA